MLQYQVSKHIDTLGIIIFSLFLQRRCRFKAVVVVVGGISVMNARRYQVSAHTNVGFPITHVHQVSGTPAESLVDRYLAA